MKVRYAFFLSLSLLFSLTACKNRFEEYEPYSAFDERMAMADRPSMVPDDQMPVAVEDDYTNHSAFSASDTMTMASKQPSKSFDDIEVPFDETRGQSKQPMNIGGLD